MPDEQTPQSPEKAQGASAKPASSPKPKPAEEMAAVPWEGELPSLLKGQFGEDILELASYVGQNFLRVRQTAVPDILEFLRDECDYDYLVDITAVDWPKREERFDLVYTVYSFARNARLRVKTRVREGDHPLTITGLYPAANWLEREVYDMFGIEFDGHPDLKRILLPDGWLGHPLRKDYSILQMDNRWVQENLGIESGQ